MLAKTGPCTKRNCALPGRDVFLDDLGAGDIAGHQVGCELDAAELQVQGPGQGGYGQRLGQPRHADRQAVAAGEQADQHLFDHLLLTDDDLVNFAPEQLAGALHALHGLFGACLDGGGLGLGRHTKRLLVEDSVAEDSLVSGGAWRRSWTTVFPDCVRLSELSLRSLPWCATIRDLDHSYPILFLR